MFEIFRGKQRMAYTESDKCLPDKETIKEMMKAGYRFVKDGKPWRGEKDDKQ